MITPPPDSPERPPLEPRTVEPAPNPDEHRAEAAAGAQTTPPRERRLGTRTSATFISLIAGAVVLVLLLVFILENTQRAKITFLGATGHVPLGVALLLAVVAGALLLGIVGTARIAQLRRRVKHRRR